MKCVVFFCCLAVATAFALRPLLTALLEKEVSFVMNRTMIELLEKRLLKGIPSKRTAEYKNLPEKVYQWKYVLDRENKTFPIVTSDDFRIILESLKNRTTFPKTFLDFGTCMREIYQELCEDMQSRMFALFRGLPYDFSVPVKKSCSPVVSIIDDIFAIENVQLFKRKVSV
nr:PREDICTED: uncharacterized protein LOC109031095 [Bemisia tabaci]